MFQTKDQDRTSQEDLYEMEIRMDIFFMASSKQNLKSKVDLRVSGKGGVNCLLRKPPLHLQENIPCLFLSVKLITGAQAQFDSTPCALRQTFWVLALREGP